MAKEAMGRTGVAGSVSEESAGGAKFAGDAEVAGGTGFTTGAEVAGGVKLASDAELAIGAKFTAGAAAIWVETEFIDLACNLACRPACVLGFATAGI